MSFEADGKRVDVFPARKPDMPVVYLNTHGHEGEKVVEGLHASGGHDLTLVAVSNLNWSHDMAPWDIPPISDKDEPCTGGADDYLRLLTDEIMPRAEESVAGEPPWRGISGYSLAGLLAVYAPYRTDAFSRVASMSGSLWFQGFPEFVLSNEMARRPDHIFMSLGEKESHTRNMFLRCVEDNTRDVVRHFTDIGIDTEFRMNPGNHFTDVIGRTVAGISWILRRRGDEHG